MIFPEPLKELPVLEQPGATTAKSKIVITAIMEITFPISLPFLEAKTDIDVEVDITILQILNL